jgi:hypothetical protein
MQESIRARFPTEREEAQRRAASAYVACGVAARCRPQDVEYNFELDAAESGAYGLSLEADLDVRARAAVEAAVAMSADPAVKWGLIVDSVLERAMIESIEADAAALREDTQVAATSANAACRRSEAEKAALLEVQADTNTERLKLVDLQEEFATLSHVLASNAAENVSPGLVLVA